MNNTDKLEFKVIIRDAKKDLYLRDTPMYRGMERWNCMRAQALRFDNMNDAEAAVDSLNKKDLDISYELVAEDEINIEGKKFLAEITIDDGPPSLVHWSAKNAVDIITMAVKLAKRAKGNLKSVIVTNEETFI